jgi:hypothetical protein
MTRARIENGKLKIEKLRAALVSPTVCLRDKQTRTATSAPPHVFNFQFSIFNSQTAGGAACL